MHKDTKNLIGKTIQSINKGAINCWVITFTDKSKIEVWAEIDGPLNLGQIWLNEYNPENHVKRSKIFQNIFDESLISYHH